MSDLTVDPALLRLGFLIAFSAWLWSAFVFRSLRVRRLEQVVETQAFMMSLVAHEFRTPITAIQLSSALHRREMKQPAAESDQNWLIRLENAVYALSQWSEALLAFTRERDGSIRLETSSRCDFNQLLTELRSVLEPAALAKGLEFQLVAEPGLPSLSYDSRLVRIVMSSLGQNAVKYTETGKISLRARSVVEGGAAGVEIELEDTGHGFRVSSIPGEWVSLQAMELASWKRWRSEGAGGWGLGLAISKKLVGLLGARVFLESVPGKGTRVRFHFPSGASESKTLKKS